ncbi:MAG: phosphatase PAP2 family protein [Sphingopyxis sp.]|uniref:phosphatase PAP2 family protein n=1 Tax=Sphingopyxis sp. TaxID=1908224 RepID=UPI002ABA3E16|nr:phosphatase PAP2 family protein [Sphingopyxis sp.]MDZ3831124.1 phosphatase PAP2 family protein [Sphingopyxis sp.]
MSDGQRRICLGLGAGAALAFLMVSLMMGAGFADPIDRQLLQSIALRQGDAPLLIDFMQGVSWLGGGLARWALVLMFCAGLWRFAGRRAALLLAGMAAVTNIASSGLKMLFARARPDVVPHLDPVTNLSYPSGHAASVAAVAIGLALLVPPRHRFMAAWAAAWAILLTGLSRMMLGVHWPTDVLGGTLLGAAVAFAVVGLFIRAR